MKIDSLFQTQLNDLLDGTMHFESALPALIQATNWAPLRLTLLQHQDLTRRHGKRLEAIFWNLGLTPFGRKCKVLREVVDEIFAMVPALPEAVGIGSFAPRFHLPPRQFNEERVVLLLQQAGNYKTAAYSTLSVWGEILEFKGIRRPLALCLEESNAMQRWLGCLAAQYTSQFLPNVVHFPTSSIPASSRERMTIG